MSSRALPLAVLIALSALLSSARADTLRFLPDLAGWEFIAPDPTPLAAVAHPRDGGVLAFDGRPTGYIQSLSPHANFRLHLEWRWPAKPGNSGVLVAIATGPIDRHVWPRCFQVQLKHTRAGDLLPMAGATFHEPLTSPPGAATPARDRQADASENPAGEWNACDVLCRDGTLEVKVNGVLQNRVTGCAPAEGRVGFQFEGAAFELRAVRLEPLAP